MALLLVNCNEIQAGINCNTFKSQFDVETKISPLFEQTAVASLLQ